MSALLYVSLFAALVTVVTYLLMTTGKVPVKTYDYVNVVVAPPIIAYAALVGAWASVLLSTSYMFVAAIGIHQKRRRRNVLMSFEMTPERAAAIESALKDAPVWKESRGETWH